MDPELLRLADGFASAAMDGRLWIPALTAFAEATGSARGQLIGIGSAATVPFNWVNGFTETELEQFIAIDGANPLVNPRVALSIGTPVLGVYDEAHYDAAATALPTSIYAEFAQNHDIPFGCQAKLLEDDGSMVGLAVLRSKRDGPTRRRDRQLFRAMAPHVRSAVRMQIALEGAQSQLIVGAHESIGNAIFLCGTEGRIEAMSTAAEGLLSAGLLCRVDGRVAGCSMDDTARLQNAVARHQSAPIPLPMETVLLVGASGQTPVVLDICRAPKGPWRFNFAPRTLIVVRSGQRWHKSSARLLQALYGLSQAEADIALRLTRGETRAEIADARSVTLDTVRTQLKSAFAKMDVTREMELSAMLGSILRI